ncbi:hypothetical protein [Alienimonas californiensis]|uniref:Uncharacterized protein n=1 Tax=Alienimonas californiensis TaxID=2527989 RepID=A0A517P4U1_9PLAN|nr:hypothetical protein [Alienimonas californiensis]QDT14393.1 hypothetical protein CA12_04660 [Alienimonas californiensis]
MPVDRPPPDSPAEDTAPAPAPFRSLGEYAYPAMPADDAVRSWWSRLRQVFVAVEESAPLIAEDRLQRATDGGFAPGRARPSCDPLRRELDAALTDWATGPPDPFVPRLQLIVLPPGDGDGDEEGLLAAWAKRHGLDVLAPPPRDGKGGFTAPTSRPPDLRPQPRDDEPAGREPAGSERGAEADARPLVVPRLERWFLRRHNGLEPVRTLLKAIDRADRRVVIGCNSWAWAFLKIAVDAHLVLPAGRTFVAFDAERLSEWFREMAADGSSDPVSFRLSATGGHVLKQGEQEDASNGDAPNGAATNYYRTLAARSLGVPWVAWDLWRRSLRSENLSHRQAEQDAAAGNGAAANGADESASPPDDPERQTLWVAALEEFTLPARHEPDALLMLQSLLIHGPLTEAELFATLPALQCGGAGVLSALAGAGFVSRSGNRVACAPAAYPSVRAGLSASGFPLDTL